MAVRKASDLERPDYTRLQAGSEGAEFLQSGSKIVTRGGAAAPDADFDLDAYDLNDGDFNLSEEHSDQLEGDFPDTGGAASMAVFLESANDRQFSISVEFKQDDGDTVVTLDKPIDSDLESTSPSDGNHFVFVTVAMASDLWNLVVTDDAGLGQNQVSGTINIH